MTIQSLGTPARAGAVRALKWAGVAWFVTAAIGQAAFIGFILAFYGVRTFGGDFASWNDKPLIDGYIAGDDLGNVVFAAHALVAAVVTLAGLMQLVPVLRQAAPRFHRWSGRIFLSLAVAMAFSGVWLTLVRGTYLSSVSAAAILINAVLILTFAGLAWRHAVKRRFDAHRLWAMRAFMVVSGVWFLRVGLTAWVLLNGGPVGMTDDMSGRADIVLTFGSYLIPLALLEIYWVAGRSPRAGVKILGAILVGLATLYTAAGVFGTIVLMWLPYVR